MAELKPCPFCGNEYPTITDSQGYGYRMTERWNYYPCPNCKMAFSNACITCEITVLEKEEKERNRGCEYCYTDAKSNPFVGGYNYCPMCGRKLKGADNETD